MVVDSYTPQPGAAASGVATMHSSVRELLRTVETQILWNRINRGGVTVNSREWSKSEDAATLDEERSRLRGHGQGDSNAGGIGERFVSPPPTIPLSHHDRLTWNDWGDKRSLA